MKPAPALPMASRMLSRSRVALAQRSRRAIMAHVAASRRRISSRFSAARRRCRRRSGSNEYSPVERSNHRPQARVSAGRSGPNRRRRIAVHVLRPRTVECDVAADDLSGAKMQTRYLFELDPCTAVPFGKLFDLRWALDAVIGVAPHPRSVPTEPPTPSLCSY